jgi:hypothetical protein
MRSAKYMIERKVAKVLKGYENTRQEGNNVLPAQGLPLDTKMGGMTMVQPGSVADSGCGCGSILG